jgi:transposase
MMQRLLVKLRLRLQRHETHGRPRRRLGDGLGVAVVVLLRLHEGWTYSGAISRTSWPCAARHPLPLGLHLRRGLSRARRGRGLGRALRRHRRDNDHLAEIARSVAPGAHAVLVLARSGWHGGQALAVPDTISLLVLPPCSPELNPLENVWPSLPANWLAISVFDDYEAIVDACCWTWNRFADRPVIVSSTTSRQWAEVNR